MSDDIKLPTEEFNEGWEEGRHSCDVEVMQLRAEIERMEAAIRWALGERADPQGIWFVPPAVESRVPRRYWWRSHLRKLSGIDEPKAQRRIGSRDNGVSLIENGREVAWIGSWIDVGFGKTAMAMTDEELWRYYNRTFDAARSRKGGVG